MTDNNFRQKIKSILNQNSIKLEEFSVCLFWDYENVSFSIETMDAFLVAFKLFFDIVYVIFSKVFFRKDFVTDAIIERIQNTGFLTHNIIKDNSKNAIDHALINSLISVRRTRKITHVILITGDYDYRKVIIETYKWVKKIILISKRKSVSTNLTSLVQSYYAVENLLTAPENWWRRSIK